MQDKKPLCFCQLLTVGYGLAAILWVAAWLLGCFGMLYYNLQGQMPCRKADAAELAYSSLEAYADHPDWTQPGAGEGWYISTDEDPHLYWQGSGYLQTVELKVQYRLPPGAVVLYYLTEGQAEYTEKQKVYGTLTADGVAFDLGGQYVTGLRVDTDSRGGVPMQLQGLYLNPRSYWLARLWPKPGQWLLLLAAPALAASFAGLLQQALGRKNS